MTHLARMIVAALLLGAFPMAFTMAKDTPKKFNYRPLPVDVSCLDGYHPTVDNNGNKVFPCVANAETVVPKDAAPVKAAAPQAPRSN